MEEPAEHLDGLGILLLEVKDHPHVIDGCRPAVVLRADQRPSVDVSEVIVLLGIPDPDPTKRKLENRVWSRKRDRIAGLSLRDACVERKRHG